MSIETEAVPMDGTTHPNRPYRPAASPTARLGATAALVLLVAALAACGSGSGSGGTGAAAGPSSAPSRQGGSGGNGSGGGIGGPGFPGASGLVAAVSPGTLQVQSADTQTTVTYTSSTRFSRTVAARLADGQCVTVTGTPVSGSTGALTATAVRVEAKVNGACPTAGPRQGGGAFGGGSGGFGQRSSGAPRPSDAPSGGQGARAFAFASGTVSSVSGETMTMQGVLRTGRPTAGATASAAPTTSTITVTLTSTTSVSQTVAATSAAAVVGVCATAVGKADDRGDIAATSIAISKPDASGCRTGFGGFGGRGFGGASGSAGTGTNA